MQVLLNTLFLSDFCVINGYILCLVTQSYLTLCHRIACSLPNFSVPGDSPGKNTGVGCYFLLQGVFLTQKWNWGLPHCRWILYQLNYKRTNFIKKKNLARYSIERILDLENISYRAIRCIIMGISLILYSLIYLYLIKKNKSMVCTE